MNLDERVKRIRGLDAEAVSRCKRRLDILTKPQGSLGQLEAIAMQLAGISGNEYPEIGDKVVLVMAGDHGVVREGVSAYPSDVTVQMVMNFIRGGAAINVLARHAGARVVVADMGVACEIPDPKVIRVRIRPGTDNMAEGPAMTRDEAIRALEAGADLAAEEAEESMRSGKLCLFATGDMGIGNTTPSSAILAVISGLPVEKIVGMGTGLDKERVMYKSEVIKRALALNKPDPRDGLDILSKVGGLEIAGIAGSILGAASMGMPVVIDGLISTAAALIAGRIAPLSVNYLIASHISAEPGHRYMLDILGLAPILHMGMRLGEGTGAVMVMGIIEASTKILREMATFEDAGVSGPA